jgi:GPH family glycoside/pentoside/hexuronide:cation symporter
MAMLGGAAAVMFLITFATTRERIKPQADVVPNLKEEIRALIRNRAWLIMVVAGILTLANVGVRVAVTAYFFKYYVGAGNEPYFWFLDKTSFFLSSGSLAFIASLFATNWLRRVFGKRNALAGLTVLNALSLLGFFFIPGDQYLLMVAVNIIANLFAGPTPALVWAIYTDVADYGEWKFKRRTTGLVFSAAMFAQKMGLAIGSGVSGWLLGYYGFQPNQVQTEETMEGIRFMFSIIPGALAFLNGVVVLAMPLTEAQMEGIQRDLQERRRLDDLPPEAGGPGV